MKFLKLNNPLATRLGRRAGCFSSQVVFGLSTTVGLLVSCATLEREILQGSFSRSLSDLLSNDRRIVISDGWLPTLAIVFTVWALVFIPYAASSLTLTYFQSQEYALVKATPLTDVEVVKGFVLATLYRCRAFVGLTLALLPAVVTLVYGGLFPELPVIGASVPNAAVLRDMLYALLLCSLLTLALGIGLGGFILMSVTLVVWSALWSRHTAPAAIIALLLPLVFYLIGQWLGAVVDEKLGQRFWGNIVQIIFFLPFPYLAAYGALHLASRWARR